MSDPPVALIFNSELDATADVSRSAMLTTKEDLPTYSPPGNAYSINIFVTTSYLNSAFYTNTYWDTNLGDVTVEDYNALIQAGNNNLSGQPKTFLFDWSSITTNTSDLDRLDSNVFNGVGEIYNFVSQNDLADATVQNVSGLLYNISFLGSVWYNHPSAVTNFANFMSPIVTISKLVETLEKINAPELSEYRDDFFNQAYLKYKYDETDYSKLAFVSGDSLTIPIKFDISQHVRYNLCGSPVENHPNNMLTFVVDTQEYVVMKQEDTTNTQVYLLNFVATDYDPTIYQLIIQNGVLLRHTGTAPANVVIPAQVTSIASNVFKNNTTVESVSFDDTNVVSIGYEAFSGCTSLTSITLPVGLESISGSAFLTCSSLTSIVIPDSVTSLGNHLLESCSLLSSVTLPTNIGDVPEHLCADCPNLTSIVIPDSVTHVGGLAFANCTSLTSITISSSLTNIDNGAFFLCTGITSLTHIVTLAESLQNTTSSTNIFGFVLDGITGPPPAYTFTYSGSVITGYTGDLPEVLSVPSGASGIGPEAFANETGLSSVTIPEGVTTLGENAFMNCTSLTSIVLPSTLACTNNENTATNGDGAFVGCTNMTNITLSNGITYIPGGFFASCSSLSSVTFPASVAAIGDYAFGGCAITDSRQAVGLPSAFWSDSEVLRIFGTQLTGFVVDASGVAVGYLGTLPTAVTLPSGISGISSTLFTGNTLIESIVIPNTVTSIYANAFASCTALTSIQLGSSLEYIGDYTFAGCGLQTLTIPNSVTYMGTGWLYLSPNLTSLTLPPTGTFTMGYYSVYGCSSLASIVIPPGFTTEVPEGDNPIYYNSENAFTGCSSLTSVVVQAGVTALASYMFAGCSALTNLTLPASVTSIGDAAFYDTGLPSGFRAAPYAPYPVPLELTIVDHVVTGYTGTLLSSLTISEGVTGINSDVFSDETGLTSVSLPSTLTSIGGGAFSGTGLTSVVIPNTVSIVEGQTFYNCSSLSSVTLGSDVTSIGNTAFAGCSALSSITIPEGVSSLGQSCFQSTALTSVVIPNSVSSIGASAFMACTALTSLTIGSSVEIIGSLAFSGCSTLTSVTLPNSVETIGAQAFQLCADLTSITFGTGVTSIGDGAFDDCEDMVVSGQVVNLPVAFQSESEQVRIFGEVDPAYVFVFANDVITGYIGVLPTSITLSNSIGASAFSGSTELTSITFGAGVTEIGDGAFSGCTGITAFNQLVDFPASLSNDTDILRIFGKTFTGFIISGTTLLGYNGTVPDSIVIPDSIETIAASSFAASYFLTSITFGANVTAIGDSAFAACANITLFSQLVNFPASLTNNTDITRIFGNTLYGLLISGTTLTGYLGTLPSPFTVPSGIQTIGSNAFLNTVGLTSLTLNASLTLIDVNAFGGCTGLGSLVLNASIQSVNASAFAGCTALSNITFTAPTSISTIGSNAFYNMPLITAPSQVSNIPEGFLTLLSENYIFGKTLYSLTIAGGTGGTNVTGYTGFLPSSLTIPAGITVISASVFSNATTIRSLALSTSLQVIASNAFTGCTGLTSLTLPTSIQTINGSAFAGCTALSNITFTAPTSISGQNSIANGAFYNTPLITSPSQVSNIPALFLTYLDEMRIFGRTLYSLETSNNIVSSYSGILPYALTIPDGITTINAAAFSNATTITSLTLPTSIQTINGSAFAGCTTLSSLTFTTPTNITTIGCNAFFGATALSQMAQISNMPDSFKVNASQRQIFGKTMYTLFVSNNVVTGAAGTLPSTVTIPAGVTCIGTGAFSITNVSYANTTFIIGNTVQTICANAFYGTTSYNSFRVTVSLGTGVTHIGSNAFAYMTWLDNLFVPSNVVTIDGNAFTQTGGSADVFRLTGMQGVTSLSAPAFSNTGAISISLGSNLSNIGPSAFASSVWLTSITIPASVTLIDSRAFTSSAIRSINFTASAGAPDLRIGTEAFWYMSDLTSLTLPSRLVSLSSNAFFQPQALRTIDLSATQLTTIPANVFSSNVGGTCVISLPPTLTSIGSNAFGFSTITSITIPASVTSIGASAFNTMGSTFSHATFTTPTSIASIGNTAFANNTNINLKSKMVNIPSSFLTSTEMTRIFGKQLT